MSVNDTVQAVVHDGKTEARRFRIASLVRNDVEKRIRRVVISGRAKREPATQDLRLQDILSTPPPWEFEGLDPEFGFAAQDDNIPAWSRIDDLE